MSSVASSSRDTGRRRGAASGARGVPTHIAREYPTLVFVGGTKMDEGAAAA